MPTEDTQHPQQTMSGSHGDNHPFKVTVRTLAGHHVAETVRPDEKVAELTAAALKHFVAQGELTAGDYALTLPRTGEGSVAAPHTPAPNPISVVFGGVAATR